MEHELLAAVERNDVAAVRAIVADDPDAAAVRDEAGVSALLHARYRGADDVVEALRQAGAELDVFEAAALGDTPRLVELLEAEPALAAGWSADGFTPLHLAAFFGQPAAVDVLLDRGADVDAVSRNALAVAPLNSAAAAGEQAICGRLLGHGANPNAASQGGFTPLHAAAQNGDADLARLLVDHGADVEATSADGRRAVDFARDGGHEDVAALLAERAGA